MCLLLAEGVLQIKGIHAKLVGVYNDHFVRNSPRHPVMTSDGLQPPDFLLVIEGDAVGFIGTVALQQLRQTQHAFPGRADIGQHQHHKILFPDAAGDFLFAPLPGLFQLHQGIRRQNTGIGGDGLRGGHAHVSLIDSRGRPDSLLGVHAGACSVGHGLLRKRDLHMAQNAFIDFLLLFRLNDDQLLHIKMSVVGTGDHSGAVIAGLASHQNSCAGHKLPPDSIPH